MEFIALIVKPESIAMVLCFTATGKKQSKHGTGGRNERNDKGSY